MHFMITKNSVVQIQNLVVNHESRPVKSKVDASLIDAKQMLSEWLFFK